MKQRATVIKEISCIIRKKVGHLDDQVTRRALHFGEVSVELFVPVAIYLHIAFTGMSLCFTESFASRLVGIRLSDNVFCMDKDVIEFLNGECLGKLSTGRV